MVSNGDLGRSSRCCEATTITDHLFMEAAEAVANSLDKAWDGMA